MNMASVGLSRDALCAILKSATSNCMCMVWKFSRVPKVTGTMIWLMGVATALCAAWTQHRSGEPHLVEGLQEQYVQGASPIDEDSVELDILDNGANNQRVPTLLWDEV
jgi:hypothetical protein